MDKRANKKFSSICSSNAEATRQTPTRAKALTRETSSTRAKGGIKIPLFLFAATTERAAEPRNIIPQPPRGCQEKNAEKVIQIHLPKIIQNDERKPLDKLLYWVYNTIRKNKGGHLNENCMDYHSPQ